MLSLLKSIFGGASRGSYPEKLVTEAIERAVDGTDPCLRAVSGYKRKLRPAVVQAIDHVVAMVDGLPPPVNLSPGSYSEDPRLKAFFISAMEMKKVFAGDRSLAQFLQEPGSGSARVVALLAMEKQEKVILGSELSGDIIIRDVPQTTVSFEAHRFFDPSADESVTRRQLMRRAYDHLLSLALRRITIVKSERETLARHRTLLQSKLDLLARGGWGFDETGPGERLNAADIEERLGQIEAQLLEVGGDDRMYETYLGTVADVLGRPGEHLWAGSTTLFIDRMGIKRKQVAADAPELTLHELFNAEGRSLVAMLVALPVRDLQLAAE